MPHISDQEFVTKVLAATLDGKIDWQPTAQYLHYSASYGGKWTILVTANWEGTIGQTAQPIYSHALTLNDSTGEQLLRIEDKDDQRIKELHELARRHALKVDEAISDFLKELDEPQP
jgi:hypothetical protein